MTSTELTLSPSAAQRIRAIGRAAATRTSLLGGITISRAEALSAMESVETLSGTAFCPSLRRETADLAALLAAA